MKHILLVALSAPPKNSPESFQIDRLLSSLDPDIRVTLLTTPTVAGWERYDQSLAKVRPNVQMLVAALPAHHYSVRVLANHRLRRFHVPDSDFWITWLVHSLYRKLRDNQPDAIYSRSFPFSSAILARRLSQLLDIPWMMHLSDPWFANPYRSISIEQAKSDRQLEERCFLDAKKIALTTEGQADFYRRRYPSLASKISVTPNMMPTGEPSPQTTAVTRKANEPIRLVYTGALYGHRSPAPLLEAVKQAIAKTTVINDSIRIEFYGNVSTEYASLIQDCPIAHYYGALPYNETVSVQKSADVLLVFEPDLNHELQSHFLPSKVLDYLHLGKPILAITPEGSETARLCDIGAGWAFSPGDIGGIAATLSKMATSSVTLSMQDSEDYRMAYSPAHVVPKLQAILSAMVEERSSTHSGKVHN